MHCNLRALDYTSMHRKDAKDAEKAEHPRSIARLVKVTPFELLWPHAF